MPLAEPDTKSPSPDGTHALVTYDLVERAMGYYDARVALLDATGAVIESFAPLSAETSAPAFWSADSAHVAFASQWGGDCFYLVWRPAASEFGVVRIGNPYPLSARFADPGTFEVELRLDQLEALNSEAVFGGGRAEWPIQRFRRNEPLRVTLDSLRFRARAELAAMDAILAAEPPHDVEPVADGFFPYDGPPLASTKQRINGRALAGVHLEAFADWGDPVAKAWLDELRRRLGARYDPWQPVAKALGHRKR